MIKHTQTKTIGTRPDDYAIVSLFLNESDWFGGEEGTYITLNVLKYLNGQMTVIQQNISIEDLEDLASNLYNLKYNYERRQREKKEAAAAKAEAQGIGSEKAEA